MWVYSLVMGKESNSLKTAFRKINTSVRNADFFFFFFTDNNLFPLLLSSTYMTFPCSGSRFLTPALRVV